MLFTEGCIICGKELIYSEDTRKVKCLFCGAEQEGNVQFPDGHFICDTCHQSSAFEVIENYCNQTDEKDPGKIARHLMNHPSVHMHGPEHHFLVPACLLTAYYNQTNKPALKPGKISIARNRASAVLGGFCGSHGNCGAAVGTGIFISIITANTPLGEKEWQLSNKMTAIALLHIADAGGPRCCKRDSYIAIQVAVDYLKKHFEVELPLSPITCLHSDRNKQCKKSECNYFSKSA